MDSNEQMEKLHMELTEKAYKSFFLGCKVEAVIVKAADAISAARPGARMESFENYIKRLDNLEKIADSIDGVEKSFAIQAGRELRVMAKSDIVDDAQAKQIARDIAKRIEDELKYPGIIRVTVIRETRAVEVAR